MNDSHFPDPTGSTCLWSKDSVIGIIGGLGEMGRLFSNFFSSKGFQVNVADLETQLTPQMAVRRSDIVLFAVPLHDTVRIIRELVPHTRPGQLLMDLTSLKAGPVKEMMRSPACVVGLHPMFGGQISSFAGQTLVACPVRIGAPEWEWLRGLFALSGIKVKESSPEEHDRMMSIIQVLFHLTTMLIGRTLRKLDIDIEETMEYTSPSYRIEMNLVGRIFAQSPQLYGAIAQMNPFTSEIVAALKDGLCAYEHLYGSGDLEGFIEDFEKTAGYLGEFCAGAFRESSAILDFSVKLANNKMLD